MLRKLLIFSIIPLLLIVPGIAFGTEMGEMEITPYPKNFQIQLVISPSEFSNHVLELINPEGKVFRVGCMGEVNGYHVMRTISGIGSTLAMMGYDTDVQAGLKTAEEKLKAL